LQGGFATYQGKELTLALPSNLVQDAAGNGFNATGFSYAFTVSAAPETRAPILSGILPASEGTTATFLSQDQAVFLTFDEALKAGEGAVRLWGKYGSGNLSFPVAEVPIIGEQNILVLAPTAGFAPGEEYGIEFDAGVFTDLAGNAFVPTATDLSWKFSTKPNVTFVSDLNLAVAKTGASAAFVGDCTEKECVSTLVVVSGSNSTHVKATVESAQTYIPASCGAAYSPFSECTAPCAEGATMTRTFTVWQEAPRSGKQCSGGNVKGDTVTGAPLSLSAACVCPRCLTPPSGTFPKHMVDNTSYLDAYVQVPATESRPLLCTEGYHADGGFVCAVDTERSSVYGIFREADFPKCVPDNCTMAPEPIAHLAGDAKIPLACQQGTTNLTAGESFLIPHNDTCGEIQCAAGYAPKANERNYRCIKAKYEAPECVAQACATVAPEIAGGAYECDSLALGGTCALSCGPGYSLKGAAELKCQVAEDAKPEAAPVFVGTGTCAKQDCGAVKLTAEGAEVSAQPTDTLFGAVVEVACKAGFRPKKGTANKLTCAVQEVDSSKAASWQGEVACEPVACAAAPEAPAQGKFEDCSGDKKFGDRCSLSCDAGFEVVGGDGAFECGAEGIWLSGGRCETVTACAAPELGEHMESTSCPAGTEVASDSKCSVTCAEGYEASGDFLCHHAAYAEVPVCTKKGSKVEAKTYVTGSLALSLATPEGKTAEDLAKDPAFKKAAGAAVAATLKKEASEVEITKVAVVAAPAGRRLEAAMILRGNSGATARRTEEAKDTATLTVEYRILVADAAAAAALQKEIAAVSPEQFKKDFATTLEKEYEGVTVEALTVEPTRTTVEYSVQEPEPVSKTVDSSSGSGALIGGIFGAIAGVCLVAGGIYFLKNKGSGAKQVEQPAGAV